MSPVRRQRELENLGSARHGRCVVCGSDNPQGLQLRFHALAEGGVEAVFACAERFAGYAERLHGGIIASLLDSAMTNCLFACGQAAVTAELNVRYHAPVAIGQNAVIRAWLEQHAHWMSRVRAELRQDGTLKASAWGKFIQPEHLPGKTVHGA